MVETSVADVVRPTVAADDPDRLFHKILGKADEILGTAVARFFQFLFQFRHTPALGFDACLVRLVCV